MCVGGGGAQTYHCTPPNQKSVHPLPPPPPPPHASYASDVFEQNGDWQSERDLKAMNINGFPPPPPPL